ncbi:MAG: B3/4 domain-containing protein [Spirochaetaceae bacterium]|jgi:DNA/RNA-binding domain of Phe-tRNA-synthetase-like protein|nr:B3/4 domain-containing protein [Spirochaetaceae bacterium]
MTFLISDEFRRLFPQARIGVLIATGIDNRVVIPELLEAACATSAKWTALEPLSANPAVGVWREAFQQFKTKKGVRSSIEALLGRVKKGNPPRPINPLVDLYNAVSLTYGFPCGGEDIDALNGPLRLCIAQGGESFIGIGEEENDPALPGEVIYCDDTGAVCRCWNWRDGRRTMLTENTKNAVLVIESVDPARDAEQKAALDTLGRYIETYLGGKVKGEMY